MWTVLAFDLDCKTSSSSIKENDGKARRRHWQPTVMILAMLSAILVWILYLFQDRFAMLFLQDDLQNSLRRNHHRNSDTTGLPPPSTKSQIIWTTIDESMPLKDRSWQDILHARVQLVDLQLNHEEREQVLHSFTSDEPHKRYAGLTAVYCHVDWTAHQQHPSETPMHRDVIQNSPQCQTHRIKVPLALVVSHVRSFDANHRSDSPELPIHGMVFHESRCGSTLVANLLTALPGARVYSEAQPPTAALMAGCGSSTGTTSNSRCHDPQRTAALLQDVVYLMSRRSSEETETTAVFFKFQSLATLYLDLVVQQGFPTVPWIFVYRDPLDVLVSQLNNAPSPQMANCARQHRNPPSSVQTTIEQYTSSTSSSLSLEQYCAAHLATLTETAVSVLQKPNSRGRAVNYGSLPDAVWTDVVPHVFGIALDNDSEGAISRMRTLATLYSKGRGSKNQPFTADSTTKQQKATPALQQAAEQFLQPSYQQLERMV